MAMKLDFGNTVVEKKKIEKKQVTALTELKESDENTIYNLIFSKKKEKIVKQP